ncbi:MAG: hypothetical protein ACAI44_33970 [Candidatus Sericytochromatia bacterium]
MTDSSLGKKIIGMERSIIWSTGGYPDTDANGNSRVSGCAIPADRSAEAELKRKTDVERWRKEAPELRKQLMENMRAAAEAVILKKHLTIILSAPLLSLNPDFDVTDDTLKEMETPSSGMQESARIQGPFQIGFVDRDAVLSQASVLSDPSASETILNQDLGRLAEQMNIKFIFEKKIIFAGGIDLTPFLLKPEAPELSNYSI